MCHGKYVTPNAKRSEEENENYERNRRLVIPKGQCETDEYSKYKQEKQGKRMMEEK